MQVEASRKSLKNNDKERIRYRGLFVAKDIFINDIAKGIKEDIPKIQQYIGNLKSDGFEVIGYVRKSYGNEDRNTRIRLLQSMIDKMLERLSVDKIYVSPMSQAGEPFSSRDVNHDSPILRELNKVEGTTQDLISYFSTAKKICLIRVDFAGITTNCANLRNLLSQHESLKKIIIDRSPFGKPINIYDRDKLLDGTQDISEFDCRKGLFQRSK
ncbi:hypothetical protein BDF20DRAFT_853347 [Mycotypha africana]|uniref:uncharacterized protein n=1 Tax=Mycotypha africana TaxID=64632 RepID=UPI00230086D5|nr:uncharacterized protein BDF20DRAFT_853347 [Mycotypha africana]KAI8988016.1 hypothetical protein BDF20DRAFT_853347 [Mycotypha africana]